MCAQRSGHQNPKGPELSLSDAVPPPTAKQAFLKAFLPAPTIDKGQAMPPVPPLPIGKYALKKELVLVVDCSGSMGGVCVCVCTVCMHVFALILTSGT